MSDVSRETVSLDGVLDTVILGDCLEVMPRIPDGSVDMILCDLPYGTTACPWDSVISLPELWKQYRRIISPIGAIVLTGSQPFSSRLVMSNPEWFKYAWVWHKNRPSGFVHAKNKPLKAHEDILVFSPGTTVHSGQSKRRMIYNPQGCIEIQPRRQAASSPSNAVFSARKSHRTDCMATRTNYPQSILPVPKEDTYLHPTQKPVALFTYFIMTYTDAGALVVDNCAGACTTAIACLETNRRYICIEKDAYYVSVGEQRIAQYREHVA